MPNLNAGIFQHSDDTDEFAGWTAVFMDDEVDTSHVADADGNGILLAENSMARVGKDEQESIHEIVALAAEAPALLHALMQISGLPPESRDKAYDIATGAIAAFQNKEIPGHG